MRFLLLQIFVLVSLSVGCHVCSVEKGAIRKNMSNRVIFSYDSVGNLRFVTDPLGFITEYRYDESNNRDTIIDAKGHITAFEFDKLNRLVRKTYPGGLDVEEYEYNSASQLIRKTLPNGDYEDYFYDVMGRDSLKIFSNSGHQVEREYYLDGKVKSVQDHRGLTDYTYDTRGRLERVDNPDGSFLEYTWDVQGNKLSTTTPANLTEFRYNTLNQMDTVISGSDMSLYQYNDVGNLKKLTHANGVVVEYTYDTKNRLTDVVNKAGDNSVISSYHYGLNDAGIREYVVEANGDSVAYGYDDNYRLTSETRFGSNAYTRIYAYDSVGNRETESDGVEAKVYQYNDRDQLEAVSSPSYSLIQVWNANGQLESKVENGVATAYTWIDDDRMETVTTLSDLVNYTYDPQGRRVAVNHNGDVTGYLIDGSLPYGQVVEEFDGIGGNLVTYVYGLDRLSMDRGGVNSTYQMDGQGSVRGLVDGTGAVTDEYGYMAFGDVLYTTGSSENSFRYNGEQLESTGLYYNRARYYNSANGRFVSVDAFSGDPMAPVSLHRYLYANGSPSSMSDPSGNMTLVDVNSGIVAIGALASVAVVQYNMLLHKSKIDIDFSIVDNFVNSRLVLATAVSSVVVSVEQDVIDKIKEYKKEITRQTRLNPKKEILISGPSIDNGAYMNNFQSPVKIGPKLWYRDGGSYPGRVFGSGIWIPNRINTYNALFRFDNHPIPFDPVWGPDKWRHVYHFHVGNDEKNHIVVGAD